MIIYHWKQHLWQLFLPSCDNHHCDSLGNVNKLIYELNIVILLEVLNSILVQIWDFEEKMISSSICSVIFFTGDPQFQSEKENRTAVNRRLLW